jgi:hypothetical protein
MPRSIIKAGQLLLILALFATCGGHWMVLQSVAWTNMLVSFSKNEDVTQAIEKTFDGQHPCDLCKRIDSGKGSEKKQDMLWTVGKLNLFHETSGITLVRADDFWEQAVPDYWMATRGDAPPVPPPRTAAA